MHSTTGKNMKDQKGLSQMSELLCSDDRWGCIAYFVNISSTMEIILQLIIFIINLKGKVHLWRFLYRQLIYWTVCMENIILRLHSQHPPWTEQPKIGVALQLQPHHCWEDLREQWGSWYEWDTGWVSSQFPEFWCMCASGLCLCAQTVHLGH